MSMPLKWRPRIPCRLRFVEAEVSRCIVKHRHLRIGGAGNACIPHTRRREKGIRKLDHWGIALLERRSIQISFLVSNPGISVVLGLQQHDSLLSASLIPRGEVSATPGLTRLFLCLPFEGRTREFWSSVGTWEIVKIGHKIHWMGCS